MTPLRTGIFLAGYCLSLWLACDFVYTKFIMKRDPGPGVPNSIYSHDLRPNFSGRIRWGSATYPMYTNSLGFRDFAVRQIPDASGTRRVVVIGDSFTEAIGVPFEDSFVGMLNRAAQSSADKTEYLNAGVASYSPTLYFRKIKFLLDRGLKFDEVIVFSDISDVQDEAQLYFCFDDDPNYRINCKASRPAAGTARPADVLDWDPRDTLGISDQIVNTIKHYLYWYTGITKRRLHNNVRGGWTIPGFDVGDGYAPLGVEGGIERSLKHMQALADLLAKHSIPLTIVVYPWPVQLEWEDRNSRQAAIWRNFCITNCKEFVDLFPAFFAYKDSHPRSWYQDLFIPGDEHFSAAGNKFVFEELTKHLYRN